MTLCLVVDDDEAARNATVIVSRELNLTTAEADDGKQAAGFCMGKMPDVILVDIMMPHLDGIAFVEKLRSLPNGKHPYIIANSATRDREKVNNVLAAGADAYLPKPFGITELKSMFLDKGIRMEKQPGSL